MEEQTEEPQPPPPPPLGWPPRSLALEDVDEEEEERSVTPLEESLIELDLDMTDREPLQRKIKVCNILPTIKEDDISHIILLHVNLSP